MANKRTKLNTFKPDFALLAHKHHSLQTFGKWNKDKTKFIVDFNHPEAQRELTKAILKEYFQIEIHLPPNHLCPPVPQRLNYLEWIRDLLTLSGDVLKEQITGFDIGVGASCIFPLLGHAKYGWKFDGTEIDPESLKYAQDNVRANSLEDSIHLSSGSEATLVPLEEAKDGQYCFTICNPPFFDPKELESKPQNSQRTREATSSELECAGGEVEFVKRLFSESLHYPTQVRWYTSMLGKKSSLKPLRSFMFRHEAIQVVRVQEFVQGRQARWGISWTFSSDIASSIRKSSDRS